MKNYRIEQTTVTQGMVLPTGETIEVEYIDSEHSAYEKDCRTCGKEFTVRGVIGALLNICSEGQCPDCQSPEPSADPITTQGNVLANNGVLFCSLTCLNRYPKAHLFDSFGFERFVAGAEFSSEEWGCLCPVCEKEYSGF